MKHRAHGGGHDASNLLVLCDGHHKLLHEGLVTITGTAPDRLTFTRGGRPLVDPHAAAEIRAVEELHEATKPRNRSRFSDVVKIKHVTQALKQLGFKARAARETAREACAHVGTETDIPTIVKKALALSRAGTHTITRGLTAEPDVELRSMAKQALVQSGYTAAVAEKAVEAACARVGTEADLPTLLKEAFRCCRTT